MLQLISGRGAKQREGGHVKFYPSEKGWGVEKVLPMLKGGGGETQNGVKFLLA